MTTAVEMECSMVQLSPAQSNEIIMEKLGLLAPRFEALREDFVKLKDDLANGIIHWDQILDRVKRGC